ncbi:tyrosine-type recombinase/integrase [Gluconacetobacter diazotrophicus]|uniref:tyrosine-type recombinase/integrase n=1 Tax=Gluconacetobacter diazotrophicus TaxID=33996 RepID=UPI000173D98F|nr:site-specific integrase [Gluconacetobacter diazotrophicus]TWB00409.1 phage integrase family protein [Gluconacetobacter diazotrophicus]
MTALSRLEEAAIRINEGMGHLRINQIHQRQWDDYAASRFRKPNARSKRPVEGAPVPISLGTLKREFNVLRAALRHAWRNHRLDKPPTLEGPGGSAPRDRYITKAEARRLLDACETPHIRAFLALAMFTGARKGSILALTWDRVMFDLGRIDFQEPGRKLTAKRRAIVPMTDDLRAELTEAHKVRTCDYVVEWAGGPITYGIRWPLKKLAQKAGLSWTPTPHHFKHSVASWMAMAKVPIDQAADWLATDPKTLRRVYRKFDPDYLREVGSALKL